MAVPRVDGPTGGNVNFLRGIADGSDQGKGARARLRQPSHRGGDFRPPRHHCAAASGDPAGGGPKGHRGDRGRGEGIRGGNRGHRSPTPPRRDGGGPGGQSQGGCAEDPRVPRFAGRPGRPEPEVIPDMSSQKFKVALVLLLGMASLFAFLLMDTPPSKDWQMVKVVIPKGSTSSEVARLLAERKVLQHPLVFRMLIQGSMTGRRLKFGEYSFPDPPSAVEAWKKLFRGEITRYSVTIPEGSNLYDIAKILGGIELVDPEKFLETAASREVLRRLGIPGATAGGVLFPDTYLLEKSMSPEDILEVMARQFRRKILPAWEGRARG